MEYGLMVVMEKLKRSVHECIHDPSFRLTVPLCLTISHEIAIGIAFLHRNNVMHRVGSGLSRTCGRAAAAAMAPCAPYYE